MQEGFSEKRIIWNLIWNLALVLLAIPGMALSIRSGGVVGSIVYYTQDSNILLGIAAVIYCIAAVYAIRTKTYRIPRWVQILKYISVCCVAVTFVVVLCILLPMVIPYGKAEWILLDGSRLFQHTISPIVAIVGFLWLETKPQLSVRDTFYALIPTFIYAAVLYPLNITRAVDGPYPFLQVHKLGLFMSVVWFLILLGISYALALLIWAGNRKLGNRKKGDPDHN